MRAEPMTLAVRGGLALLMLAGLILWSGVVKAGSTESISLLVGAHTEADIKAWGSSAPGGVQIKKVQCGDREALAVTVDRGLGGYVEDVLIFRKTRDGWELVVFWQSTGSAQRIVVEAERSTLVVWRDGVPVLRIPKDGL